VLSDGRTQMAIVTMDLSRPVSDRLRERVVSELQIPLVLMAVSHTHSGPALPAEPDEPSTYREEAVRKIFDAVKRASESMFPARLAVARGSLQLGYNRLLRRDDGRSRALFDNLERIPYGPVDPEFMLLGVLDQAGAVKALLVHYAVHAVVLGPTNCKYSADYPGVLLDRIESAMPGVQAMFVQGAAGDVNPLFMARTGDEEKDFAVVRKMGETLAGEVLRAARTLRPLEAARQPIQFRTEVLKFSDRWEKQNSVEVGISTVLIGRDVAIAAMPGEPLHRLQTQWKHEADVPHAFFYGYTISTGGGWPGYIPDVRSAAYGGYGADVTTRIEPGAGERIVLRHLIHLYDLLGMWRDKPGNP
jgi:neutral ceramidase